MDYGASQSAASFPLTPPAVTLNVSDLPASVVAQAAAIVADAGITNPAAAEAAEYDYLVTGNPDFVASDAAATQTITPTTANATPSSTPVALGVYAAETEQAESPTAVTPVVFDLYLTGTAATATTVTWTVVAPNPTTDFAAADFGGSFPSGTVTIAAGQTTGTIAVNLPIGAIASATNKNLDLEIGDAGVLPIFGGTAETAITGPTPGAAPVPELQYLGTLGTFTHNGNEYTLDLGAVQVTQILPKLQFSLLNAATAPADQLSATLNVADVTGFTVTGATIPAQINPGNSYSGLQVTANEDKFGDNVETITFNPVDTNPTGFSASLTPFTLTIADTLELPSMVYSEAWGDVHIITYNQLEYNFQQVGEFVLAESRIPGDSFAIQMRLQQWFSGASVSVITQVAIQLGTDSVTFDWTRPDTVWVDGTQSTISQADPTLILPGGTITEVSPTLYKVAWDTGETMTVTNAGAYATTSSTAFPAPRYTDPMAACKARTKASPTTSNCPTARCCSRRCPPPSSTASMPIPGASRRPPHCSTIRTARAPPISPIPISRPTRSPWPTCRPAPWRRRRRWSPRPASRIRVSRRRRNSTTSPPAMPVSSRRASPSSTR